VVLAADDPHAAFWRWHEAATGRQGCRIVVREAR